MIYRVTTDTERSTVLAAVDKAAGDLGILWFLCGAYSRVLLCEEAMRTPIGRATNDLDCQWLGGYPPVVARGWVPLSHYLIPPSPVSPGEVKSPYIRNEPWSRET